jgi:hypothetical protein
MTTPVLAALDSLFGLPAHPLVVHAAVVLIPLAAVGVCAIAFWPAARRRIGWIVLGLAFVGMFSGWLAKESGEGLEDTVKKTQAVEDHAEMGDSGTIAGGLVFLGAAGVMAVDVLEKRRASQSGATAGTGTGSGAGSTKVLGVVVGVVAVLFAVGGAARIVQIGHSGAKATWEDNKLSSSTSSGSSTDGRGDADRD